MLNFTKKKLKILVYILSIFALVYSLKNNFNKTNQRLVNDELIDKNIFDFDVILDYDNIKSLNKLFKKTIQIFNKNNISYWSFGGTLIGAIKNKGNLAWDDDHDLCLMFEDLNKFFSLEQQFKQVNIGLTKSLWYFKLFDLNGKNDSYNNSFPFVDIFFTHKINNTIKLKDVITLKTHTYYKQHYFYYNDLFPLKKYQFEDYEINGPNEPFEFLNRAYPDWQTKGKSKRHFKNRFKDVNKVFPTYYYNPNITKSYLWLINTNYTINYESVVKYCSNTFEIMEINSTNIQTYLPELNKLKLENKILEQSLIKIILMYKYGGLFIDCSSVLILNNLDNILNKLKLFEFISFGCSQNEPKENKECKQMSSSIMASRPKRVLMEYVLKRMISVSFNQSELNEYKKYKNIAEQIIWEQLNYLIEIFGYEYFHYSQVDTTVLNEDSNIIMKLVH